MTSTTSDTIKIEVQSAEVVVIATLLDWPSRYMCVELCMKGYTVETNEYSHRTLYDDANVLLGNRRLYPKCRYIIQAPIDTDRDRDRNKALIEQMKNNEHVGDNRFSFRRDDIKVIAPVCEVFSNAN